MKFFALVALAMFATANAQTAAVSITATPNTLVAGETPTSLIFVITASATGNIVKSTGTITVTPSSNVFTGDGNTACTATATDGTSAVTAPTFLPTGKGVVSLTASAQKIIFTMGAADTDILSNNGVITITCTDNLAANAATALAITFSVATTGDDTPLADQTGYTLKTAATAFSATRGGSYLTGEAPGALVFSFTPTTALAAGNTIKLTSNVKLFTSDSTGVTCTATYADIAVAVPTFSGGASTDTGKTLTLTLTGTGATNKFPAAKAATITCTSATGSLNNMDPNTAAGDVKFSFETQTDLEGLVDQTGYTICAATGCPTSAASSTASVGMLTMLALAGVAMRQ